MGALLLRFISWVMISGPRSIVFHRLLLKENQWHKNERRSYVDHFVQFIHSSYQKTTL